MIEAIKADLGAFTKDITVDSFGNVMARFEAAKPTDQTVMVFAHTDQLGMIVTKVEPNGFIRVVRLGGDVADDQIVARAPDLHSCHGGTFIPL